MEKKRALMESVGHSILYDYILMTAAALRDAAVPATVPRIYWHSLNYETKVISLSSVE